MIYDDDKSNWILFLSINGQKMVVEKPTPTNFTVN